MKLKAIEMSLRKVVKSVGNIDYEVYPCGCLGNQLGDYVTLFFLCGIGTPSGVLLT